MIRGLERFVGQLRAAGIAVSTAEWLEGLRALELTGIEDRERLRRSLRCVLVKRRALGSTFDRVFDEHFVWRAGARGAGRPGAAGTRTASQDASRRPSSGGAPRKDDPGREAPPASTPTEPVRGSSDVATARTERVRRMHEIASGSGGRLGRLRTIQRSDEPETADRIRRPGPAEPAPERRAFRHPMSVEDERELARGLARIVRRLRLRRSRRLRRQRRGVLHLRGVFRENLTHEGVPFVLPRRRPRRKRPGLVLLVDVSWSVARAAGLFFSMTSDLLDRRTRCEVRLFVDRAVPATRAIESWGRAPAAGGGSRPAAMRPRRPGSGVERGGRSFASLIESLPGLIPDAPSDYGRTFDGLSRRRGLSGGRSAVLVVLGDGRTNRFDPQAWAFETLARRFGTVLWMVPEPFATWHTGDSALPAYLPHADLAVEVRDLEGLERGVAAMVRRL